MKKIKQGLACILVFVMALGMLPCNATAEGQENTDDVNQATATEEQYEDTPQAKDTVTGGTAKEEASQITIAPNTNSNIAENYYYYTNISQTASWLKFTTSGSDSWYHIEIKNINVGNYSFVELEDSYGEKLWSVTYLGTDGSTDKWIKLRTDETYYLKSYASNGLEGNLRFYICESVDDCPDTKNTSVSRELNTTYNQSLDGAGDVDWFSFTTSDSSNSTYRLTAKNNTNSSYFFFEIYSAEGELVSKISYLGAQGEESSDAKLPANTTYYLQVYASGSVYGNYAFSITDIPDDTFDVKESATKLEINKCYDRSLEVSNDVDWFSFTTSLGTDATYRLYLRNNTNSNYLHCVLYAGNDEKVAGISYLHGQAETTENVNLSPNTIYYLEVYGSSSVVGNYSFSLSKEGDDISPAPTISPEVTATPTPSPTATATLTPSPTATATLTPSPTATATPTPSPTVTATPTPSSTVTAKPTATPTTVVTPTPTTTAEEGFTDIYVDNITSSSATVHVKFPKQYVKKWGFLAGESRECSSMASTASPKKEISGFSVKRSYDANTTYYFYVYYITNSGKIISDIHSFKTKAYSGKLQQSMTAKLSSRILRLGSTARIRVSKAKGTVSYSSSNTSVARVSSSGIITPVSVGIASISVKASGNNRYKPSTKRLKVFVRRAVQKISVEKVSATYSASSLALSSASFSIGAEGNGGKITCRKVYGSDMLSIDKYGVVTVQKGIQQGNYNMKVKIRAAMTETYSAKTITKTIKVKVV